MIMGVGLVVAVGIGRWVVGGRRGGRDGGVGELGLSVVGGLSVLERPFWWLVEVEVVKRNEVDGGSPGAWMIVARDPEISTRV